MARVRSGEAARPSARRPARRGELGARVLVAVPALAYAVAIIVTGGWVFALGILVLGWAALAEIGTAMARARPPMGAAVLATSAAVFGALAFGPSAIAPAVALSLPLAFGLYLFRRDRRRAAWGTAVVAFATLWVGVPLAHAVLLRELDHGAGLVVDVLVGTFVGDSAAYLGGRALGTTPLAARISPNKTVEGLLCGIVGGTVAVWVAGLYQDWLAGTDALLLGLAVAVAAPIGDLFESLVKRDLGVKDLGRLFGAHGGVLDRLDAALFAIVVGYYVARGFGFA